MFEPELAIVLTKTAPAVDWTRCKSKLIIVVISVLLFNINMNDWIVLDFSEMTFGQFWKIFGNARKSFARHYFEFT